MHKYLPSIVVQKEMLIYLSGNTEKIPTHILNTATINLPFVMYKFSNHVSPCGLFYCLGTKGNLGVHDPNNDTCTVLSNSKQFKVSYKKSFLVESDRELVAVVVEKYDRPIIS